MVQPIRNAEPPGKTSCKLMLVQVAGIPLIFALAFLHGDDGNTPAFAIGFGWASLMIFLLAPAGLILGLTGLFRPADDRAAKGLIGNLILIASPVLFMLGQLTN